VDDVALEKVRPTQQHLLVKIDIPVHGNVDLVPDTMRQAANSGRAVLWHLTRDDQIRIVEGLRAGETIATSAVNSLREGMLVKPMSDLGEL